MNNPHRQLLKDHEHLVTLLRLLRAEVQKYDDSEEETDVNVVVEALDYLNDYPNSYHHPLEEASFDYLIQNNLAYSEVIQKIRSQHQRLEEETAELFRMFQLVSRDQIVPVSRIKDALNRYLDLQFEHIDTEEKEIFPVMEKSLGPDDWKEINSRIRYYRDPLFNGPAPSYPELKQKLDADSSSGLS